MIDDTEAWNNQPLQKRDQTLDGVVEIILYQLKAGMGRKFHQIMEEISVPLHHKAGLRILAFGNSLHAEDTYFLIRSFEHLAQMTASLNSFYKSDDWLNGPRSDILECITSSTKSVLPLNEAVISALKFNWARQ